MHQIRKDFIRENNETSEALIDKISTYYKKYYSLNELNSDELAEMSNDELHELKLKQDEYRREKLIDREDLEEEEVKLKKDIKNIERLYDTTLEGNKLEAKKKFEKLYKEMKLQRAFKSEFGLLEFIKLGQKFKSIDDIKNRIDDAVLVLAEYEDIIKDIFEEEFVPEDNTSQSDSENKIEPNENNTVASLEGVVLPTKFVSEVRKILDVLKENPEIVPTSSLKDTFIADQKYANIREIAKNKGLFSVLTTKKDYENFKDKLSEFLINVKLSS